MGVWFSLRHDFKQLVIHRIRILMFKNHFECVPSVIKYLFATNASAPWAPAGGGGGQEGALAPPWKFKNMPPPQTII